MKIAFLFRSAPHGSSKTREGLDALLAATAFCDEQDIGVFFVDDGVLNLLNGQQPERLLQKDFVRTFKLLDLYDINQRFVCQDSLEKFGITENELVLSAEKIDRTLLMAKLNQAEKLLTF
ncbi:sulfurtransferase complex subunit TusC [Rodentibacter myodis]|uniref:Sulfurtransferase TusC n=1 Tax=Rodentibacter myodis TaxID=1907939 RepID=A0A1V3JQE9_9PAST|nr:sulfurtransferase complex subunit TusC [Rodentibacter myodis]OOF58627.1 sulfurtransferase TusC [Rodentibacter myodis]